MSRTFSDSDWTFEWSAAGVGPTVIFLSHSPLNEEGNRLARALEKDFFVIHLVVIGRNKAEFAKVVEAFFEEQQLWRVHWVVAKDAADLARSLAEHLPRAIWSMTVEGAMGDPKVKTIADLGLDAETALREEFARVDPPYRTSEHPL
jgi:hypothetical protein